VKDDPGHYLFIRIRSTVASSGRDVNSDSHFPKTYRSPPWRMGRSTCRYGTRKESEEVDQPPLMDDSDPKHLYCGRKHSRSGSGDCGSIIGTPLMAVIAPHRDRRNKTRIFLTG